MVARKVHTPLLEEEVDVAKKLLAVTEGVQELGYDISLSFSQLVGIVGINSGEEGILEGIGLSIGEGNRPFCLVDAVQKVTILHPILGVTRNDLMLELELYDGDGLVHLPHEEDALLIVGLISIAKLRSEGCTGVLAIDLHSEARQRKHVDPVAILQRGEVGIAQGDTYSVGHAGGVPDSSTHPEHIVVTPLDVYIVVGQELVHDELGTRTSVKDVSDDMQAVDGQTLDRLADRDDEVVGLPRIDDRVKDSSHVS